MPLISFNDFICILTDDAWLAIRGRVYNITYYLPYHPGGIYIHIYRYILQMFHFI